MSPTLRGVIMMTIGTSVLSIMDAVVKWLIERDISSIQLISIRGWIIITALVLSLVFVPRLGGFSGLKTRKLKFHLGRSLLGVFAPILFFVSLKYIPLANAVSIFFCSTFFMTAGSAWILDEQVGIHRWSAVILGFIGVVIALQPGTQSFQLASLLVVGASASYAFILISGRWLSRTESSLQLIFYFTLFNTIICSLLLLIFWSTFWHDLIAIEMGVILALSGIALIGYYFITQAFTMAPISAIAPIEYIALVWALLIGYLVWDEVPNFMAWIGMILILSAGLYIGYRESRQTTREIRPAIPLSRQ